MREIAENIFERFCTDNKLPTCKIIYSKKIKRRIADFLTIIQDSCIIVEVKEKQVKSCNGDQCSVCDDFSICNTRADREIDHAVVGHVTIMDHQTKAGGVAFKERLEDASDQIANTIIDFQEGGINIFDDIFFMLAVYNRVNIANYFTDHEITWGFLRLLGTIGNNKNKRNYLKLISSFAILPDGVNANKIKLYYNPISDAHINPTVFDGLPIEIYVLIQDPRKNNKYTFSFDWVNIDDFRRMKADKEPIPLKIVYEGAVNRCIHNCHSGRDSNLAVHIDSPSGE